MGIFFRRIYGKHALRTRGEGEILLVQENGSILAVPLYMARAVSPVLTHQNNIHEGRIRSRVIAMDRASC